MFTKRGTEQLIRSCRPKFFADVMLGSLAKWLRILGYDTAYDNRISDDQLIDRCRAQNRIALTRDGRLMERRQLSCSLFIESEDLFEQIQEVLNFLGEEVDPARLLSRCVECNAALESVSRQAARGKVPSYVFKTQLHFKQCPDCDRIYWGGTHRDDIYERLRGLTKEEQ
ncbi:MAG: Mut7-C RNAse domain-containing protein [Acidobacteriota bacterium]